LIIGKKWLRLFTVASGVNSCGLNDFAWDIDGFFPIFVCLRSNGGHLESINFIFGDHYQHEFSLLHL